MKESLKLLQDIPSDKQFEGINECRRVAWELNGEDYYPYHAFSRRSSWERFGELGKAIQDRELFVSVVEIGGEVVAHAALVANKFGWELGRVFASVSGHGYGTKAVEQLRLKAEKNGIAEIHRGTSYNRTAAWHSYENSFGKNGWHLAVLGILPDIYAEPKANPDMQWGEIISRAVKGKAMELPQLSQDIPAELQQFARGIQHINNHSLKFSKENVTSSIALPYRFSENTIAISWNDFPEQHMYMNRGYQPVSLIKIHEEWHFVLHKGNLPERKQGRGDKLIPGRNPVIYPEKIGQAEVGKVIDFIYGRRAI